MTVLHALALVFAVTGALLIIRVLVNLWVHADHLAVHPDQVRFMLGGLLVMTGPTATAAGGRLLDAWAGWGGASWLAVGVLVSALVLAAFPKRASSWRWALFLPDEPAEA